jgi:glycosyltransferase involved in cell wall biosynthesis
MFDKILVSVVIPTYNCAEYINETLISTMYGQSYDNTEIIIVDDGSTDDTYKTIFEKDIFKPNLQNIRYYKLEKNMGACYATAYGFERAHGKYICYLGSDDMFFNRYKIMDQVDIMEKTGCDFSYYRDTKILKENPINTMLFDKEYNIVKTDSLKNISYDYSNTKILLHSIFDNILLKMPRIAALLFIHRNPVNSSSLMIRRESLKKYGNWNKELRTDCDGDLLLRFLTSGARGYSIPNPTDDWGKPGILYRVRAGQLSQAPEFYQCIKKVRENIIKTILESKTQPTWYKMVVKLYARLFN